MKKMILFKDVVPVRILEAYCDFCGELRVCVKATGRTIDTGAKEMATNPPDICYACANQSANLLLENADEMEDGQLNP